MGDRDTSPHEPVGGARQQKRSQVGKINAGTRTTASSSHLAVSFQKAPVNFNGRVLYEINMEQYDISFLALVHAVFLAHSNFVLICVLQQLRLFYIR